MVNLQTYCILVVAVIFTVIEGGLALRCWKCSSQFDNSCRDYFNATRILINQRFSPVQPGRNEPQLADCEAMHTPTHPQYKNVCLKRVITVSNGPSIVSRECRLVSKDLKDGYCPDDITYGSNSRNLEFCGTCEQDGCNSASKTSLVFVGLVPAVIMLLGK